MAEQPIGAEQEEPEEELELPELPQILDRLLAFALEEAREGLLTKGESVPHTVLVVKDVLFIESHPGETEQECRNLARHTVEGARGSDAYAFCYDGYVETEEGKRDALIAEGGLPGEDSGFVFALLYDMEDEQVVFPEDAAYVYLGDAPNFMEGLKEPDAYDEDEIDERYREEAGGDDDYEGDDEGDDDDEGEDVGVGENNGNEAGRSA